MTEENPYFDPAYMAIEPGRIGLATDQLRAAFVWSKSRQGAKYWIEVMDNLHEIQTDLYARAQIEKGDDRE